MSIDWDAITFYERVSDKSYNCLYKGKKCILKQVVNRDLKDEIKITKYVSWVCNRAPQDASNTRNGGKSVNYIASDKEKVLITERVDGVPLEQFFQGLNLSDYAVMTMMIHLIGLNNQLAQSGVSYNNWSGENILVIKTDVKEIRYDILGKKCTIPTFGYIPILLNYGKAVMAGHNDVKNSAPWDPPNYNHLITNFIQCGNYVLTLYQYVKNTTLRERLLNLGRKLTVSAEYIIETRLKYTQMFRKIIYDDLSDYADKVALLGKEIRDNPRFKFFFWHFLNKLSPEKRRTAKINHGDKKIMCNMMARLLSGDKDSIHFNHIFFNDPTKPEYESLFLHIKQYETKLSAWFGQILNKFLINVRPMIVTGNGISVTYWVSSLLENFTIDLDIKNDRDDDQSDEAE